MLERDMIFFRIFVSHIWSYEHFQAFPLFGRFGYRRHFPLPEVEVFKEERFSNIEDIQPGVTTRLTAGSP